MHQLIKSLARLDEGEISFERICDILNRIECAQLEVSKFNLHSIDFFTKQPLLIDLMSIYLINWPSNIHSSIHEHKNFQGVIKIIEGELIERCFSLSDTHELTLDSESVYKKGEMIIERNNAIHQVINPSVGNPALSLHVYFPSTVSLEGSRLFDPFNNRIAILSKQANSFSWDQPAAAFHEIRHTIFKNQIMSGPVKF